MSDQTRIKADHVSYTYDEADNLVLNDVSLEIKAGEFVAVLGHNGCGKSTLAKLLNGLYVPTDGKVTVCGMDTSIDENVLPIRQRAGMIFQNPDNQIVASIVKEDVAFGLENLGIPTEEMLPRIESALNSVHMIEYADSAPHLLSGGQKQRVAIAGIIAMQPDIIIADESTSMLDPSGRKDVLDTVLMLNKTKGITVVWITHFMEEAAQADRIVVMSEGRIVTQGKPRDVFDNVEMLRSIHLDVPHMTALASELRKDGMPLPKGILTVDEMVKEVAALLCPSK